jgi:hypothetical protein
MIGKKYEMEDNYGSKKREVIGKYVIREKINYKFEVIKNDEVYKEINLMKYVIESINKNYKEIICLSIYSDEVKIIEIKMRRKWM